MRSRPNQRLACSMRTAVPHAARDAAGMPSWAARQPRAWSRLSGITPFSARRRGRAGASIPVHLPGLAGVRVGKRAACGRSASLRIRAGMSPRSARLSGPRSGRRRATRAPRSSAARGHGRAVGSRRCRRRGCRRPPSWPSPCRRSASQGRSRIGRAGARTRRRASSRMRRGCTPP